MAAQTQAAGGADALFTPFKLAGGAGAQLKHRVVYAPLTRCRAIDTVPTPPMVEYYRQRATDGGLMIAEATCIMPSAHGCARALLCACVCTLLALLLGACCRCLPACGLLSRSSPHLQPSPSSPQPPSHPHKPPGLPIKKHQQVPPHARRLHAPAGRRVAPRRRGSPGRRRDVLPAAVARRARVAPGLPARRDRAGVRLGRADRRRLGSVDAQGARGRMGARTRRRAWAVDAWALGRADSACRGSFRGLFSHPPLRNTQTSKRAYIQTHIYITQPLQGGPFKYPAPRPLTKRELQAVVQAYADCARNAIAAGFDGVEVMRVHGGLVHAWGALHGGFGWRCWQAADPLRCARSTCARTPLLFRLCTPMTTRAQRLCPPISSLHPPPSTYPTDPSHPHHHRRIRSTPPTATCSRSSSRRRRTGAPTSTAAAWRTAAGEGPGGGGEERGGRGGRVEGAAGSRLFMSPSSVGSVDCIKQCPPPRPPSAKHKRRPHKQHTTPQPNSLLFEVMDAVTEAVGAARVGVRLSPFNR